MKHADLSKEFNDWKNSRGDFASRYYFAKEQLENDLIFLWKTISVIASRTVSAFWKLIVGLFLLPIFMVLWFCGEL